MTARDSDNLARGEETTASISAGETVNGRFHAGADRDAYAIELKAHTTYDFSLVSGAGFGISVLNANGYRIESGRRDLTVDVSTDGTYFVVAQAIYGEFGPIAAEFRLSANISTGIPGNTQTQERLVVGTPLSEDLYRGDSDWFGVTLEAETTYRLVHDLPIWSDTRISIHDASGIELAGQRSYHNVPVFFSSGDGGEFFAGIEAMNGDGGAYGLRIDPITDIGQSVNTAADMPLNTARSSHLFKGDEDWFAVTPDGDTPLLIIAQTEASTGIAPVLSIRGEVLAIENAVHIGVASAVVSESDPFVLSVSDRLNTADFYTLHVAQLRDAGTDGREALMGTNEADTLSGLANNDTLLGAGGG